MNFQILQIKYKQNNFEYNYNNIKSQSINNNADLIILPEFNTDSGMEFDFKYQESKEKFYKDLCEYFSDKNVLIGTKLIQNGELFDIKNKTFNVADKTIYVSDEYKENIECDLYVLAKNRYYAMNTIHDFIENIVCSNTFVHINPIMMDEEKIYAGQSFIKSRHNNLLRIYPFLEEKSETINIYDDNVVNTNEISTIEEIFKATTFSIKEYCENCGFKEVVLGLSGGIDSALVATLATNAIGKENVYAVMLPSKYSSEGSIKDSEKLVSKLGINVETISISPLFETFMTSAAKENKMDLAEENLQSRLRGLILMFNSNRYNRLLLSTGNKSEVACGYGTLYGDMCGGLNPIADLTKTKVYELSNWINRNGEIIPNEIIEKAPSAELHPNQKDSDSLPEYEILDKIIVDYIENQISYEELLTKYDKSIVDKTLKLIYRAQFKRNQACLGIRLTEKAFCSNVKLPLMQKIY